MMIRINFKDRTMGLGDFYENLRFHPSWDSSLALASSKPRLASDDLHRSLRELFSLASRVNPDVARHCEQVTRHSELTSEVTMILWINDVGQVLDGFECRSVYKNDQASF